MVENSKRILILGLGGAGCSCIERIAQKAPADMNFAVVDSDVQTLGTCTHIVTRLAIGKAITDGMSAGGDLETGRRCADSSASQIENLVNGVDLLMVVAGLGGGVGSGAAPVIARIARNVGAHTLFFTILPFPFEGLVVRDKASSSLRRLRMHADAIVQMPNDRIQPDGEEPLIDSLERSSSTLAAGVVGLWRLLAHTGICNLDFSDVHTLLHCCDANCRFTCASATGEARAHALVDSLRSHPLADDGAIFENAPGVLVCITGGEDLTLSEAQQIMEGIVPKTETCWVKMGVAIDPAFDGRISAMVLTAEVWKEPLVDDGRGGLDSASGRVQQGELLGLLKPRSRAFGGSERTVWRGEDLDVPTYLRRKIKLPR